MTRNEIDEFAKPYKEQYGWELMARTGAGGLEEDEYLYLFVDDANICITINPKNKGFRFRKNVDMVFMLKSDEFTPLDYKDHFERNYLHFRKIVLDKEL